MARLSAARVALYPIKPRQKWSELEQSDVGNSPPDDAAGPFIV